VKPGGTRRRVPQGRPQWNRKKFHGVNI